MTLTETQKKWAIGGGIGAVAVALGYALFHSRPAFGAPSRQLPEHPHRKRKKPRHAREDENARGEYGQKKRHHHKGHKHD